MYLLLNLIGLLLIGFNGVVAHSNVSDIKKPHIILIIADDLGWNDVGFHGSTQIPTPNIDALAYSGVILNNYYVQPLCTPSRSALMTGYHPIHTGLQHATIGGPHPYGLPLGLTILPQHLNTLGYHSMHIGKWHLGCFHRNYTPTYRGFNSHFGYWTGRIDYYDHTAFENPGWWGYDMRRNMSVALDTYGKYSTDLFTDEAVKVIEEHSKSTEPLFLYLAHLAVHSANPYDPLQAPADVVERFSYIEDINRRKFAGMLTKLDDSVGAVVKALQDHGMLKDSIVVFTTDNGGPAGGFNQNAASNWPLRGVKATLWEGGVRGAGLVWSNLIQSPGRVSQEMMHVTDWFPTLYTAAGGNSSTLGDIDGKDLWDVIAHDTVSSRYEFLVNYDPILDGAALRFGNWKLLYNPSGYGPHWDGWFGPSGRNQTTSQTKLEQIIDNIKYSLAGTSINKLLPNAFQNIPSIRDDAEVLCGPVPDNATLSCSDKDHPCLFNIAVDPCEYHDQSTNQPTLVNMLLSCLQDYINTAVEPLNKRWDPAANPKYWDYTWTNWKDFPSPIESEFV